MIRFFAAHPTAGNLMMIAFMLAGLMTVSSLRRETLPTIEPRKVSVSVAYPRPCPYGIHTSDSDASQVVIQCCEALDSEV